MEGGPRSADIRLRLSNRHDLRYTFHYCTHVTRPEPLEQKKNKKKNKKNDKKNKAHDEEEEKVEDPFKNHDDTFWFKRNFVNQLQSRRQFKANMKDPRRLYSHRVRRSPSLPAILVAPRDQETGQTSILEPAILRLQHKQEPIISRRRRLSGVISLS